MKLDALLAGVAEARVTGDSGVDVGQVRDDSRLVSPGDVFVALPGVAANGLAFLADAIARGAAALVVQRQAEAEAESDVESGRPWPWSTVLSGFRGAIVTVPRARHALALMASNQFPTGRGLTLTAVTGTNGKTTTTYLLEAMLRAAGIPAGVIGTISYRVGSREDGAPTFVRTAPLTTPGSLALHALFAEMRAGGAEDVVLEASSHALHQARLDGCRFRVAGLTNLTQDHLDYHGTMEHYLDAKAILFERLLDPAHGVAVLPVDRPEGRAMRARVRGHAVTVLGVAGAPIAGADVVVESAELSAAGVRARFATPRGPLHIVSPLVGEFNLANITLAVGMGLARGLAPEAIVAGLRALDGVPGRLERVANARGVLCVVDYAHTPDALERAIAALRPLLAPAGRLLTLFGCGGDRDRTKRPLMGQAAARACELVVITSDNPRTENPEAIIASIVEGARREFLPRVDAADLPAAARGYAVVADRRAAIRAAVDAARAGDVLLLAGKGHEDYQVLGVERIHFDDREEAAAAFAALPPLAPAPP